MESLIGQQLIHTYQNSLVIASFVTSAIGAFIGLLCARAMFRPNGTLDKNMACAAALSLGGVGIWAMHFVGMLAYHVNIPVQYDMLTTLISLLAAILFSGIALVLAGGGGKFSYKGWAIGSVLAGLGVAAMHYMGMFAMTMSASMTLDIPTVILSVFIAIAAASAALWITFHVRRTWLQFLSGIVMAAAVCSMHYVGMSAATLICTAPVETSGWVIGGSNLDFWVVVVSAFALLYPYVLGSKRLAAILFNAARN